MQCFKQNYIIVQASPFISLDELIVAIIFARVSGGSAKVVVSRMENWSDLRLEKLMPESYVVVPALVLASLVSKPNPRLNKLAQEMKTRELSSFEFNLRQGKEIRRLSGYALYDKRQQLGEDSQDLLLCSLIRAIAFAALDEDDHYLDPLLEDSYYLHEKSRWGDQLTTLFLESVKVERNDEQWTDLINRIAGNKS